MMLSWLVPTDIPQGVVPDGHPPTPGAVVAPLVPIPCCQWAQLLTV